MSSGNPLLTFLLSYHVWETSQIQVTFRFKRFSRLPFLDKNALNLKAVARKSRDGHTANALLSRYDTSCHVMPNTQILDGWLKLDGWTGNWNGCHWFSQQFERFRPWVEKSNGFRLGWIEVKTIVQEPVVNPLNARFYQSDLMYERRQVSTNIQLSVISVLMEGQNFTGIWQVRVYDTGDRWYEENKKVCQWQSPGVHLCILLCWVRMTSRTGNRSEPRRWHSRTDRKYYAEVCGEVWYGRKYQTQPACQKQSLNTNHHNLNFSF